MIKKVVVPGTVLNIVQTDEDFAVPNAFPRPDVIIATKSRITITLPSDKDIGTSILVVNDTNHRIFVVTDPIVRRGGQVVQGPTQIVQGGASHAFTSTPSGTWSNGAGAPGPAGPPGPVGPSGASASLVQIGFDQLGSPDLHFTSNFFTPILSIAGNFTPGNHVQVIANFSCVSLDNALPSIAAPTVADFQLSVANGAGPDTTIFGTGTELTFVSPDSGVSGNILAVFIVTGANPHTLKLQARVRTAPRSFNINVATAPDREHVSLYFQETRA